MAYGVWFFFFPQAWVDITDWPYFDPAAGRVMASLLIAFGFGSLMGYRAELWEQVEILVVAEIIWLLMGTIGMFWSMIENLAIPTAGRVNAAIMLIFLALSAYAYFDARTLKAKMSRTSPLR